MQKTHGSFNVTMFMQCYYPVPSGETAMDRTASLSDLSQASEDVTSLLSKSPADAPALPQDLLLPHLPHATKVSLS